MDYWTYNDENGFFELSIPANWSPYDDEPNVHAFFDTTGWTGNLRITHYYKQDASDNDPDNAEGFIADQVASHEGAARIILGPLLCAYYVEPSRYEDDEPLTMYYWMAAAGRHRFACSLAAPEEQSLSLERSKVLQLVEDIIASIVLY